MDHLEVEVYFAGYADRLIAAGGLAVHVPSRADPAALVARVDGLVLTGGADVDPTRFGEAPLPTTMADPARDAWEIGLLAEALAAGIPILAICRGIQLLNVHLGGTLHQHLPEHPKGFDGAHEVSFTAGSVVAGIYGPGCPVNSLHHQAVATPAAELVVTGRAPDGVIEAVELPGRDVLGLQWHPEQLARPDPVFDWFVARCAARR